MTGSPVNKLIPFSIPALFLLLIEVFSVRTAYQNCTCPEFILIDPIEHIYLSLKYIHTNIRTDEIVPETDFVTDGPAPAFNHNTLFGYYLNPQCEDRTCTIRYPQFRILYSIPTFFLFVMETVISILLYYFIRNKYRTF